MKKFSVLVCLVLCLAMLTACGSSKSTGGFSNGGAAAPAAPAPAATEAPATEAPPAEAPAAQYSDFMQSEVFKALRATLDDTMGDYNPQYEFDSENNICYIYFDAPDGTAQLIYSNPSSIREAWTTIVENMCALSSSGRDLFLAGDYNVSCVIMLLNDTNPDNVLLGVMDGEVLYDIMDE